MCMSPSYREMDVTAQIQKEREGEVLVVSINSDILHLKTL